MRRHTFARALSAVCLLPMLLAAAALSLGGQSRVDGLVDDATSCVDAGAMYVAERDECAFTSDVDVPAGRTLVLGGGLSAYSFHRDLDVRGTLVAHSDVTTAEDPVVVGALELADQATVHVGAADQQTTAGR